MFISMPNSKLPQLLPSLLLDEHAEEQKSDRQLEPRSVPGMELVPGLAPRTLRCKLCSWAHAPSLGIVPVIVESFPESIRPLLHQGQGTTTHLFKRIN